MSNPACILVYGRDPSLLKTRCLVLQSTGGEVYATTDREEAERILREKHPDLAVLCYTLSDEERAGVLREAARLCPEVRTLVLTADGTRKMDENDLDVFAGARAFRARVVEILDRRAQPSY